MTEIFVVHELKETFCWLILNLLAAYHSFLQQNNFLRSSPSLASPASAPSLQDYKKNAVYKVPILIQLNAAWHFTENILYTILIVKLSFKAIAESWRELYWCLYPFLANVPILFPRKSPENQRFSGVFSRYIEWEHWQEMV